LAFFVYNAAIIAAAKNLWKRLRKIPATPTGALSIAQLALDGDFQ
jgi:hypothetical protein